MRKVYVISYMNGESDYILAKSKKQARKYIKKEFAFVSAIEKIRSIRWQDWDKIMLRTAWRQKPVSLATAAARQEAPALLDTTYE